jgi:hypothetical protein
MARVISDSPTAAERSKPKSASAMTKGQRTSRASVAARSWSAPRPKINADLVKAAEYDRMAARVVDRDLAAGYRQLAAERRANAT